ncbi:MULTISPECIES: transglutaminase domain-containing protein [Paenibacillus]|uniref:Transglutaminase-like domain-containing protein n=1 Tax=Paenibacillus albilobatus TaxID=2716884 RepID=A0A920C9Z9_9BACL|nr:MULTISPECIES: hypothetical protein [Paenibacillus]GIO31826.1 hypothetical protein J2TS6_29670 [Paenibacillus albilobatus]
MFGHMQAFTDHYLKLLELTGYSTASEDNIPFQYQCESEAAELRKLRQTYDLEKAAGSGDELSRIINLMKWVGQKLKHGDVPAPDPCHALHVLEHVRQTGARMNCYAIATVLNEAYLSLGFRSRRVYCRPYDPYDPDSHVVTAVFSESLRKWVYMDASWSHFVTDDQGILLSPEEFRYRLGQRLPVRLNGNPESSEWNEFYLSYMAKNLFWFMTPLHSEYNAEAVRPSKTYCVLLPEHFEPVEMKQAPPENVSVIVSRSPLHFWSPPAAHVADKETAPAK